MKELSKSVSVVLEVRGRESREVEYLNPKSNRLDKFTRHCIYCEFSGGQQAAVFLREEPPASFAKGAVVELTLTGMETRNGQLSIRAQDAKLVK